MIVGRLWRCLYAGLAAGVLAAAPAGPAQAQQLLLEDQRVDGVHRLCTYRYLSRVEVRRIGRGEPCPYRFRRPAVVRQGIPAFATLRTRTNEAGRSVCVYSYLGRDYRQVAPGSGFCAYTPVAQSQ